MRFGAPPDDGRVYTTDSPVGPALLIPSTEPSNESTWSLLLPLAVPVSRSRGVRLAMSNRYSSPWLFHSRDLPSRVQLGAWIELGEVATTVRSPFSRERISTLLPM